jgi:ribosome-binding protein aMBF1 (putative translation factor)
MSLAGKRIFITGGSRGIGLAIALKAAREERGLSHEELAELVCLKKWHIKELEETETFLTFYTMAIKIRAAKRIGSYLGLSEDQFLSTNEEMG